MRVERIGRLAAVANDSARVAAREALLAVAHEIRRVVFVDEQRIDAALEWDGLDDDAEHFVVFADTGEALGTARFRVNDDGDPAQRYGKAERVAVHAHARRTGAGRRLMEAIEARAAELGLGELRLNAQVAVLPFYEGVGYEAYGDVFVEADIDHRAMTRSIPAPDQSTQR